VEKTEEKIIFYYSMLFLYIIIIMGRMNEEFNNKIK